jgi:tRNA (adenine57-N1/adenine58-N1)-methyltransferase
MGGSVSKQVILVDRDMKKYYLSPGSGMQRVPNLGVFDTEKLTGLEPGTIVEHAGEQLLCLETSVLDITSNLKRGPQVILPKDAAQIIIGCDIRSGSLVLEVGAGSGALTVMLAQSVFPNGKVTSYERNKNSVKLVKRNVQLAGYSDIVEVIEGDANDCTDEDVYDAVITDIPEPWELLPVMERAMRPGGFLCAYVPSMNQVELTVKALRNKRFLEVMTLETLQRTIVVGERGTRPDFQMLGHTGYLCFGRYGGEEWGRMK